MTDSFVFDDFTRIRDSIQSLLSVTRRTLHAMAEPAFSEWETFGAIASCAKRCNARVSFLTDDDVKRHAELIEGVTQGHPGAARRPRGARGDPL